MTHRHPHGRARPGDPILRGGRCAECDRMDLVVVRRTLFLPADTLAEMQAEADRLGRGLSWVVQRAWVEAKAIGDGEGAGGVGFGAYES